MSPQIDKAWRINSMTQDNSAWHMEVFNGRYVIEKDLLINAIHINRGFFSFVYLCLMHMEIQS